MEVINKLMDETLKSGIGQAIIAFGAWGFVIVLLIVLIYYAFLCLFRLIF